MSVSQRILEIRKDTKLSQSDFGASLGEFKQSDITNIERDVVSPSVIFLRALHNIYSVNLNWLIAGSGKKYIEPDFPNILTEEAYPYSNGIDQVKKDIDLLKKRLYLVELKLKNSKP